MTSRQSEAVDLALVINEALETIYDRVDHYRSELDMGEAALDSSDVRTQGRIGGLLQATEIIENALSRVET